MAALGAATLLVAAQGCSEITISAPDGSLVVANSVEAGNMPYDYYASPARRGEVHGGHEAGCLEFTGKYGFIAGMNEVGLGVNGHALDLAVFQQPDPSLPTLCKSDFEHWALGMHATVAEVVAALRGVRLVGGKGGQWGLHDATGASAVIEYVKGELTAHNNTVGRDNSGIGLMTNDPTWGMPICGSNPGLADGCLIGY
jgi:penicillin V acylase-like amidase (Ntn superfamily)